MPTFYRLPRRHHRNLKSSKLLERLNEEIELRTQVARIAPRSRLRVHALAALPSARMTKGTNAAQRIGRPWHKRHPISASSASA